MCSKKNYCSSPRCLSWRVIKRDLVSLYYKLGEVSLGVGPLHQLDQLIGDLLELLHQGAISAVDLVKLWELEGVSLTDVLRRIATTYGPAGFGLYDWVPFNIEDAGQALDRILIDGKRTLGFTLHPELRNDAPQTKKRRTLVQFVDEFVACHLISSHPGFHEALFPGAVAGAPTP